MTIATAVNRVSYVPGVSTGPFAYPFRIYGATDLRVVKRAVSGSETVLTYPAGFSVTGIGESAGTITLTSAMAAGETLVIRRVRPVTQLTDLRNQGAYFPASVEDGLDHLVMVDQQQQDEIDRAFRLDESFDPSLYDLRVSPGAAGTALGWNAAATGLTSLVLGSLVALPFNVVNVKDSAYGALGNGVADDTAAVALAVAVLAAAGGGWLYFPPGTYILSQLAIPSNVRVFGNGRSVTILKKLGGSAIPLIVGSDTTNGNSRILIEGLTVDGNRANQAPVGDGNCIGVRMDRWSFAALRQVDIKDCATDGVILAATVNDATHFNEYILLEDVHVRNSRRNGLSIISAKKCVFRVSSFNGSNGTAPEAGVDLEPDFSAFPLEDLHFESVVTADNAKDGWVFFGSLMTTAAGPISIYARNCTSRANLGRGFRVARIDDDGPRGIIELTDCLAEDNGDIGFYVDEKSFNGALVKVVRPVSINNANGTIQDAEGTRAHFKSYAAGGATLVPGGVIWEDPYALTEVTDKVAFLLGGAVDWDGVIMRNLSYTNLAAAGGTSRWGISNYKRLTITSDVDDGLRQISRTSNTALTAAWHETLVDNTGAVGPITLTLPTALSRATHYQRFRARVTAAQEIILAPQAADQIVGLTGAVNISVSAADIGSEIVVENAAAGKWRVVRNRGFLEVRNSPALQNGWVTFGGGDAAAAYFKDASGMVHLEGRIKDGVTTVGTLLFTLPVGYRPLNELKFAVDSAGAHGRVEVEADGEVRLSIASGADLSLSGISFRTQA